MLVAHFICSKGEGLQIIDRQKNIYRSCCWDLGDEDANSLLGGWVYFHQNKAKKSYFGGQVIEAAHTLTDNKRPNRFEFTLVSKLEGKDQVWRGQGHSMAWYSGLLSPTFEHELTSIK